MIDFDPTAWMRKGSPVGPRMALALWLSAVAIYERAEHDDKSVVSGLPAVALTHAADDMWRDQLVTCFGWVAERLASGAMPIARCTGEEYALHIVISRAAMADTIGDGVTDQVLEEHGLQLLPDVGDDDFAEAHAHLFEDHDYLMLFDPVLDGIEDPRSEVNRRLGIGPLLHPLNWFTPFPAYVDVDPRQPAPEVRTDEDVLAAAGDLAMRTGARSFSVRPKSGMWVAEATYREAVLSGFGEDSQSAATALVREIVEGETCPSCAHTITIDPGSPADQRCHWQRMGARWERGCEEPPHDHRA